MNMTLYHGEPNGPSLTVLATLFEKGLEADLARIDLTHGERHGPNCERSVAVEYCIEGEGPVLVVDGEAMSDSIFIACFLDETGSGTALRPTDPYARWELMMWVRRVTERCAPAAALLGCRAHLHGKLSAMLDPAFEGMIRPIKSEDLKARWRDIRAGHFADEQVDDSIAKITDAVSAAEERLEGREWLLGDFSIADLNGYAWLAGMVELVPQAFAGKPRVTDWLERIAARPSVMRALSLANGGDPRQSWAPGPEINRWG